MRICILTQPLEKNYGGILQAYALQKVLKDMGHQVVTLRFKPLYAQYSSWLELYWKTIRRFLSKIKGNKSIIRCNPEAQWQLYREVNQKMEDFIYSHIDCLDINLPINFQKLPPFDAFIVGSDQVWRPVFSPRLTNFYLDFLGDRNVKRIAYAASFGVDSWESTKEATAVLRHLAQKFDQISVREESALSLCRDYLGVEAVLMPDPTLLLTQEDYLRLCGTTPAPLAQPYIATYFIDADTRKRALVTAFANKNKMPVISVGGFNWEQGSGSMENWISGLAHARYVITDSFHGTVFSLLFQKDFVTFDNGWRGSSRFHSLLDAFKMRNRLVNQDNTHSISIPPIDKDLVYELLCSLRDIGLSFLAKTL